MTIGQGWYKGGGGSSKACASHVSGALPFVLIGVFAARLRLVR